MSMTTTASDNMTDVATRLPIDTTSLKNIDFVHFINPHFVTSGMPKVDNTQNQFEEIKKAGVEAVVNLIPPVSKETQPNIAAIYNAGLLYYTVPFDPSHPITSQESFSATMDSLKDKNVLVFCAKNYRASIMSDAWNTITSGKTDDNYIARDDLKAIASKVKSVSHYVQTVEDHYNIKIIRD